jgi:hypothetical protein
MSTPIRQRSDRAVWAIIIDFTGEEMDGHVSLEETFPILCTSNL